MKIVFYILFLLLSVSIVYSEPITPTSFTFAVVGDPRVKSDTPTNVHLAITDKISASKPAFVLNTGDLVYKGAAKDQWRGFDKLIKPLRDSRIPYYPTLGNHDYNGGRKQALANYFARFPETNHQQWYSFTYSNSAFIALDSNFADLSREETQKQSEWLLETITRYDADNTISFIFAYFHHSPYTNCEAHSPSEEVQQKFVPVFTKSPKIKFVFSGHSHTYERFLVNGISYVVTGGGGATLKDIKDIEDWRYQDMYDSTGRKPRGYHFCLVTVRNDTIQLQTWHTEKGAKWTVGETIATDYTNLHK
ncbi:MAG: metallophosphoesterase [Planctomycetes bacterium]|nr:metallophosphoesterase [Planctomycetota bacterium]